MTVYHIIHDISLHHIMTVYTIRNIHPVYTLRKIFRPNFVDCLPLELGWKNYSDQPYSCPRGYHLTTIICAQLRTTPETARTITILYNTEQFPGFPGNQGPCFRETAVSFSDNRRDLSQCSIRGPLDCSVSDKLDFLPQ